MENIDWLMNNLDDSGFDVGETAPDTETRDELRREVARYSAQYFAVCAELDEHKDALRQIIANASRHGLLGQIMEGLTDIK